MRPGKDEPLIARIWFYTAMVLIGADAIALCVYGVLFLTVWARR